MLKVNGAVECKLNFDEKLLINHIHEMIESLNHYDEKRAEYYCGLSVGAASVLGSIYDLSYEEINNVTNCIHDCYTNVLIERGIK